MSVFSHRVRCYGVFVGLWLGAGLLQAQTGDDVDFKLEASKPSVRAGETFTVESVLTSRCCAEGGGQGWSYGITHDRAVLEILEARIGADAEALFNSGFNQTALSTDAGGAKLGFIQGYVASFSLPIFVPISNRFGMAVATYRVNDNACGGAEVDKTTRLSFSDQLRFAGGPPVDINYTFDGTAVVPTVQTPLDVTIGCATPVIETTLELTLGPATATLPANQTSTTSFDVMVKNTTEGQEGEIGAEAWSYAIALDGSLVAVEEFAIGADAQEIKGGSGPDFAVHDTLDADGDTTIDHVIAGGVVDLGKPVGNVLPLPLNTDQKIGLLTLKSAIRLDSGAPSRQAPLAFEIVQGDDQVSTIEVLFTINQESIVPGVQTGATLTLTGAAAGAGLFVRADANNDRRIDIADGIWIIQFLFYGGMRKPCLGAADANDDNSVDISDSMFIFNYQLQPGRTSANLYPRPSAPFPDCGTDPDLTAEDCPAGSTHCDA